MYRVVLAYQCGHTECAEFAYPEAARDWQRSAKTELCPDCTIAARDAAIAAIPAPKPNGLTPHARRLARKVVATRR